MHIHCRVLTRSHPFWVRAQQKNINNNNGSKKCKNKKMLNCLNGQQSRLKTNIYSMKMLRHLYLNIDFITILNFNIRKIMKMNLLFGCYYIIILQQLYIEIRDKRKMVEQICSACSVFDPC